MRTPADVRTSKFPSPVLRHDPARIGLTLDSGGWVTDAVPDHYLALVEES